MAEIIINQTTLEFDNIYYADAIDGDDNAGDGSINSPFKTFTKAYNSCAASGDAIYLGEGEYAASITVSKNISIIGGGIATKLVYNSIVFDANSVVNLYRMILRCNANPDHVLYLYDSSTLNIHNCIIDTLSCKYGTMGASSYTYNVKANIYNSVFIGGSGSCVFSSYAYGTPEGLVKNCISIDPITLHTYSGRAAWSLTQVSNLIGEVDQSYNIIGQIWQNTGTGTNPNGTLANIGVYGGEFAWGEWALDRIDAKVTNIYPTPLWSENTVPVNIDLAIEYETPTDLQYKILVNGTKVVPADPDDYVLVVDNPTTLSIQVPYASFTQHENILTIIIETSENAIIANYSYYIYKDSIATSRVIRRLDFPSNYDDFDTEDISINPIIGARLKADGMPHSGTVLSNQYSQVNTIKRRGFASVQIASGGADIEESFDFKPGTEYVSDTEDGRIYKSVLKLNNYYINSIDINT